MPASKAKNDHLYLNIADGIEQQIMENVLNIGDKLPSVRNLSTHHDVSVSTALQAYYHLEGKRTDRIKTTVRLLCTFQSVMLSAASG